MDLLWPGFLILFGLIPLLIAAYVWMLRRRRRFTIRYSSLTLIHQALPQKAGLRRHLPFALFVIAIASLVIALSRPVSIISVPAGQTTIILAIDVSRSMCSTDISPNRLKAAESAALSFIQQQKSTTQIGIVAFSSFAEIIQPPTADQEVLQSAIESLTTGRRTAIGSGILKSLDAIAEIDKNVAPSITDPSSTEKPTPVPKGAYAPDIIVLLTDGVSNQGPIPVDAAQQAVDRGIRIYTIGFGTDQNGSIPFCDTPFLGNEPFGGGGSFFNDPRFGSGGGGFRRGIDEQTLKEVADMTGGSYYPASSAHELHNVFQNLPTYLIMKHETSEISVIFTMIGALIAAIAVILSLLWHPLP
jgi:Ca-activated chloride channel family protein